MQQQDIHSHQNVLSSFGDRAANAKAGRQVEELSHRYKVVSVKNSDLVNQLRLDVAAHEEFHDNFSGCTDLLNSLRSKMAGVADVSGDKFATQTKLDIVKVYYEYVMFVCAFVNPTIQYNS